MGATTSASRQPGERSAPILRAFRGKSPRIDPSAWVAPGAVLVGDVEIGPDASIWYGTVVRGDVHYVRIGARTNIQDNCVLHVTQGRFACLVGEEVTVGHRAVVHGCTLDDGALVGIGAVVLDGAHVGEGALVGAGAVVAPGARIGPGALAVGVPARVVRQVTAEERELQQRRTLDYVETARAHARED